MGRITYRVSQFVAAVRDVPPVQDAATLGLTAEQYALWQVQAAPDRRHTLAVWTTLREAGHTDPDLLRAALLHDVAKTVPLSWPDPPHGTYRQFRLWHRCAVVLLRAFAPKFFRRLSAPVKSSDWRYPFYLSHNHATLSAILAKRAGCPTRTLVLIAGHSDGHVPAAADPGFDTLLQTLYWADDRN